MPRKLPNRNGDEISVRFNDGMLEIVSEENHAPPGYYRQVEIEKLIELPFQKRTVGVSRYYNAKQNQIVIEMVLRVPKPPRLEITNKNLVRVGGRILRIDLVQEILDVFPVCLDLTIVKYEQRGANHEMV